MAIKKVRTAQSVLQFTFCRPIEHLNIKIYITVFQHVLMYRVETQSWKYIQSGKN